jgi:hypothetical protein
MARWTKYKYGIWASVGLTITTGTFILFDAGRNRIEPQDWGIPWLASAERCIATSYQFPAWQVITNNTWTHTVTGTMNVGWYGPGNTQRLYSAIYEVESETTWTNPMASAYRAPPYLRTNVWVSGHSNGLRYIRGPYDWIATTGGVSYFLGDINSVWVYSHTYLGAGEPYIVYDNISSGAGSYNALIDAGFSVSGKDPVDAAYVVASGGLYPRMPGGQVLQTIGKRSWKQEYESGFWGYVTGLRVSAIGSLITNQITTNINGASTQILNQVVYMDAPVLQHDLLPNAIARPEWADWVGFSDALASSCGWYMDTDEFKPDGTLEGEWINEEGYATNFAGNILPALTFSSVLARTGMGYNSETVGSINDWSYRTNVTQRQISASNLVEVYTVANYLTHTFMDAAGGSDNIGWITPTWTTNNNHYEWFSPRFTLASDAINWVETHDATTIRADGGAAKHMNELVWSGDHGSQKVRAKKTARQSTYQVTGLATDIAHTVIFYTYAPFLEVNSQVKTNIWDDFGHFDISGTNALAILGTVSLSGLSTVSITIGSTSKPPNLWPDTEDLVAPLPTRSYGYGLDDTIRKATVEWDFEFATTPP